jgi:hypothetical protein
MDNVWSWDEEERKRREQAAPLQGIQYRAGGEAPPPQQAPAQKTDPLTQYATSKAIGAADRQLEKGADSIWKSGREALANMKNAPTAEANQAILSDTSVAQVGAPMGESTVTSVPFGASPVPTAVGGEGLLGAELTTSAPLSAITTAGGEGAGVVGGELLAGASGTAEALAAAETLAAAEAAALASTAATTAAGTTAAAAAPLAAGAGAAAAEGTMLAAMGPVGWGIGAVLLAQQLGLFG